MRKKPGRPVDGPKAAAVSSRMSTIAAALVFVQAAGGLEQAKATLTTLEQIRLAF